MLDKLSIAGVLREIGQLLALRGGEHYKARAYENGARALEGITEDVGRLINDGRLTEVRGIGRALAAVVEELWRTGRSGLVERLRAEVPPGYVELSRIPGLGPAKIRALHEALGIDGLEALERACV